MSHRRMLSIAFVALAALLLGGCYFPVNERPRYSAVTPGPMPSGIKRPQAPPAARATATVTRRTRSGSSRFPIRPACLRVFPHIGRTPELDDVATPLIRASRTPHYRIALLPPLMDSWLRLRPSRRRARSCCAGRPRACRPTGMPTFLSPGRPSRGCGDQRGADCAAV